MHSNVSIALRVKRCNCEKHLLCLSAPSAHFLFWNTGLFGHRPRRRCKERYVGGLGKGDASEKGARPALMAWPRCPLADEAVLQGCVFSGKAVLVEEVALFFLLLCKEVICELVPVSYFPV